jgi:hypothetical protein
LYKEIDAISKEKAIDEKYLSTFKKLGKRSNNKEYKMRENLLSRLNEAE